MKTLKNLLPLFAIVLGIGLVFTQSAFKSTITKTYQYQQANNDRLFDETAWADLDIEESQSCSEGSTLPCVVEFEDTEFADIGEYLEAYPTRMDILNDTNHLVSDKNGVINP